MSGCSLQDEELAVVPAEVLAEEAVTPRTASTSRRELPFYILTEHSQRKNGATAGRKDKVYYDMRNGRRFRSRLEVFQAEDEERRQPIYEMQPISESVRTAARAWKPDSVTWVITGPGRKEGAIPYVDGKEVPYKIRRVWAEDFEQQLNGSKRGERKREESKGTPSTSEFEQTPGQL